MNITILVDRSYNAMLRLGVSVKLNRFLLELGSYLPINGFNRFRFGAFGSTGCAIDTTSSDVSQPFSLRVVNLNSAPHELWTEKRSRDMLDTLKGQPFPSLGVNNIREVLHQATTGPNAADHVVLLASWTPGELTHRTWLMTQSVASVTLVNLEEPLPATLTPRHLRMLWWVSDLSATAKKLAKKCAYAKKPMYQFKELGFTPIILTSFEQLHLDLLNDLRQIMLSAG